MSDEQERRIIIDRANRMLKQSQTLRKLSDELLDEAHDLRRSAKRIPSRTQKRQPKRKR